MTRPSFDYPGIEHPDLSAFADLAEVYCRLVDSRRTMDGLDFIHRLHLVLAALYSAGLRLPPTSVLYKDSDAGDVSELHDAGRVREEAEPAQMTQWHDLYSGLNDFLGENTYYRKVFDPFESEEDNPEVIGSLADDIADIYRDLARGLQEWRSSNSGGALWEWRFRFEHHWGEHATSALRALHCRAARHDTWFPPSA